MSETQSTAGFALGADALGVFARVSVDPAVYSETAILKTAYWLTDRYYVYFASNAATGLLDVELRLKQGEDEAALKAACGELWNAILDQEVRQRVLAETSAVRDTLLRKAFFEARAQFPQGTVERFG